MSVTAMRRIVSVLLCSVIPSLSMGALVDRGANFVYDDQADLTWLRNWSFPTHAQGEGDSRKHWEAALSWADDLVVEGLEGWSLPTWQQYGDLWSAHSGDFGIFDDVQIGRLYWAAQEYEPSPWRAWHFEPQNGRIGASGKDRLLYVVAVRAGDVLEVPEPSSFAMATLGLALCAGVASLGSWHRAMAAGRRQS